MGKRDNDKGNYIKDIPNLGFSGDHFLRPLFIDKEWETLESKVLFVDPSGRGADETAWAIVGVLNGIMYVLHIGGTHGDPSDAMTQIAIDAKKYDVQTIEVEPNFGQDVACCIPTCIIKSVAGGCTVCESEWAKGQKELRIIDTLEPVLAQHRLVIDEDLARLRMRCRRPSILFVISVDTYNKRQGVVETRRPFRRPSGRSSTLSAIDGTRCQRKICSRCATTKNGRRDRRFLRVYGRRSKINPWG